MSSGPLPISLYLISSSFWTLGPSSLSAVRSTASEKMMKWTLRWSSAPFFESLAFIPLSFPTSLGVCHRCGWMGLLFPCHSWALVAANGSAGVLKTAVRSSVQLHSEGQSVVRSRYGFGSAVGISFLVCWHYLYFCFWSTLTGQELSAFQTSLLILKCRIALTLVGQWCPQTADRYP